MVSILGTAVAADALRYAGRYGYVWGGKDTYAGDWDCSSFASWVLGRDLRMNLPGGRWGGPNMPPGEHGPVVSDYIAWTGAVDVPLPQAGDLCCWGPDEHIGIAINATEMVSALNPRDGTLRGPIGGAANGDLIYRRVTGVAGGAGLSPVLQPGVAGKAPWQALVVFGLAAAGILIAGAAAAGGLAWFLVRGAGS